MRGFTGLARFAGRAASGYGSLGGLKCQLGGRLLGSPAAGAWRDNFDIKSGNRALDLELLAMRRAVRRHDRVDRQSQFTALQELLQLGFGVFTQGFGIDIGQHRLVLPGNDFAGYIKAAI